MEFTGDTRAAGVLLQATNKFDAPKFLYRDGIRITIGFPFNSVHGRYGCIMGAIFPREPHGRP